jgi:hypothetical protein
MVTKRTGRPRGRPRKPARPRLAHGRPKKSLRNDPDRFEIALLDAMLALGLGSERACAAAIVTNLIGVELEAPKLVTKSGRSYVATSWRGTQPGAQAGTLEGRIATLRGKRRDYQSEADLYWRMAMSAAFNAAIAIPDKAQAERVALHAATMAGEECEYARLLQLIAARFSVHFSIQAGSPALS